MNALVAESSTWPPAASVGLLAACLVVGCAKDSPESNVTAKEPAPVEASASANVSASAAATPPPPPPKPPTMRATPLDIERVNDGAALFTIDGAVMVAAGRHIGRLDEDGVAWVGEIPPGSKFVGLNQVRSVVGSWPDFVGATYSTTNGRSPEPTYHPLKGGGGAYTFAPGGGGGWVGGVAKSGETTTIAGFDFASGYRIIKVHGPMVKPAQKTPKAEGCKVEKDALMFIPPPAVPAFRYTNTRAGTIVSLGIYCKTDSAALEVWADPKKPSQILPLWKHLKKKDDAYSTTLLQGKGDTLYLVSGEKNAVLRLRGGKVDALPKLAQPRRFAFVSPDGDLFASDGLNILMLVGDKWVKQFELAWSDRYASMARAGGSFVFTSANKLYKLRETPSITLDPTAASTECATPFVHIFDVSDRTQKQHRFPDSAKRLGTFESLDKVKLVDFRESGRRRIGIVADDWETAKAVLAHARETNPKHQPRLICYAPKEPRVLPVKAVKKPAAKKPATPATK